MTTAAVAPAIAGDACLRWDMRRDMDPQDLLDVEERLQRDPRHALEVPTPPDPGQWATGLARGIWEILIGQRPLTQLRRWVVPALYAELEDAARRQPPDPQRHSAPCLPQSVHVSPVREGIVEVCVTIRVGPRSRAMAMRLEDFRGRWLATALDIG